MKFLSRGSGYVLFLTGSEAVLSLQGQDVPFGWEPPMGRESGDMFPDRRDRTHLLAASQARVSRPIVPMRIKFLGANKNAGVEGMEASEAKSNYFIGNDPRKWHTNVPVFASVKYHNVYPGTDLVYYGNRGQLESDFILAPGANPSRIKLRVGGAKHLVVDPQGDLVVALGSETVQWRRPAIYQRTEQGKKEIAGGYRLNANDEISFWLGTYDATRPLVIDPVLVYSTYLGGSNDENFAGIINGGAGFGGVATDPTGNVYVTGGTLSADFPTLNAVDSTCASCASASVDTFVAKYSPTGTLLYSTFLGGSFGSAPSGGSGNGLGGIAVDSAGSAYIAGTTPSPDFPVTPGAYQTTCGTDGQCNGGANAFVTKLSPTGSSLVYSTFLGGSCFEDGNDIAVNSQGIAYVTGDSCSPEFPVTPGAYHTTCSGGPGSCTHLFVTLFNPTGSALVYSALFGGNGGDVGNRIRFDSTGAAYVTGATSSSDFPTVPSAPAPSGGAFVTANGGLNWSASSSGLPGYGVTALAVDPVAPSTVYAGTPLNGLYRSVDSGHTWSPANTGFSTAGISAIAIDPTSHLTVYAVFGGSIAKSVDGGNTWTITSLNAGGGQAIAVVGDPSAPQTIYVGRTFGGVLKSLDGGQTFTTMSNGLPNILLSSLVIDPQNHSVLYVSFHFPTPGIFKTTDGAQTWTPANNGFGNLFTLPLGFAPSLPLAIDSTTSPSTLYAGFFGSLWKSSDGAANWTVLPANFGPSAQGGVQQIALDTSAFPNPPTIYLGLLNAGARKSTDGGATWTDISTGLDRVVHAMALTPGAPSNLYAGTVLNTAVVSKLSPDGTSLQYSRYLSGNGRVFAGAIAVDSASNAYITGSTSATDFPLTAGAFQTVNKGFSSPYVTKLNPAGGLLYSTYVGGSGVAFGAGIATDASGNAFVGGFSYSTDFPTVNPLFPITVGSNCGVAPLTRACGKGILFELNATGTALLSSTYFGGSLDDYGNDLAMDATPSVSMTGATNSPDFPVVHAAQSTFAGGNADALVMKIDFSNTTQTPTGSNVVVAPNDSATGKPLATVTYASVTQAGSTTLGTTGMAPAPPPANFQVGNPATYYEISSSAAFTGWAQVCVSYAGVSYADPTELHLFEYSGGSWVDVTTSLNTNAMTVCGKVTSFSTFAVLQRTDLPPTANAGASQTVGCAGPNGASVTLNGSGSTDPNGKPLIYSWSGPFGAATGVSPTVVLPLGTSTVTLVVNDGVLSSAPSTVTITVSVTVSGLGSPLAALVPTGQTPPFPANAFQDGRTLPLKLDLACAGKPLAGAGVTPPRIVALTRNGDALNLPTIDPDPGDPADGDWIFGATGNDWQYNLRTSVLSSGTYVMTIQMPDSSKYGAGFVLR